jgi:poly-gamma-glutamate capsule biosynthesis protein CapA/YwtB (metallophosphatase superfamily)
VEVKLALAGDTMLGRKTGEALTRRPPRSLVSAEVVAAMREADVVVLNLECCISERGTPWPNPHKPFFFRAPLAAVELLLHLGVDCVTLANNHALDYGEEALVDTFEHLAAAGIASVGAGRDLDEARAPAVLERDGFRLGVVAFTDHPDEFAAAPGRPGVAFAELRHGVPDWVRTEIERLDVDAVLATPHWGPNMTAAPVAHVVRAAGALLAAGATIVAGHSAHVFHGVQGPVLYDLGDFLDDYAVDPVLRNDLGLLFFVDVTANGPVRLEALPLKLDYCFTGLARRADAEWVRRRFHDACAALGTTVTDEDGRLVVAYGSASRPRT